MTLKHLAPVAAAGFLAWEIGGAIRAGSVLVALWYSGGDVMKLWICLCALAGVALTVIVPRWIFRRMM